MSAYRIIFMGTPAFSVPALKALHENHDEVLAVVTQPDRPKGRGRRMVPPPVKEVASTLGYPVLQPARIKEPWFVEKMIALDPDIFVVVAYGRILPGSVLAIPRLGAINIHASLLPKYRGPAPIQWAIINGEQETGVTTMWMDEGMDTGEILLTSKVPIRPDDTSVSLHHRLADVGAQLLIETLNKLRSGDLVGTPQDKTQATYAPFLKKEDGRIDWTKDAKSLDAFIRGMNPWPGAFTFLFGKRLKIFKAEGLQKPAKEKPGTVLEGFPEDFNVATGRGILALKEVQLESAKRISVKDFLRGCPVPTGTRLG
ncbi:MAG: methionyl-tRNA formyltransferase [Deltaproteobacteria bacterium]|nr:methionyl-tRNA formyltransferase [Deltaproteobacteria bacterium]MBW2020768.1 methionyl-tRNA formyltransferase [Deltaproteobacteria bacterium]MBW2075370.1 methionyl-tRNA formyltransferase [Deltaproteobacteria bacterium]RLB80496.1 MAG: methionyl-tRNA formyltransferase [Deltaproteobacteria bacterium]